MIVTRLKLANVRAVEAAEFSFKPGFNLIVGINGVGKTTALDALATCLAGVAKQINHLGGRAATFLAEDIRAGSTSLTVDCEFEFDGSRYTYLVHRTRERGERKSARAESSESTAKRGDRIGFLGPLPPDAQKRGLRAPLTILFSTRRALTSRRTAAGITAAAGKKAAFAEAFSLRELRLGEFSEWMRGRRALLKEDSQAPRMLQGFEKAVRRFLPGYSNLRVGPTKTDPLLIDRGHSTIKVHQLSDGERGALALVLDLTRRLAQANPGLKDPAAEGSGVVLIDELDLHLHPKWQREIVHNLPAAFPKLQFIATTHSPQVIGEVEHNRIQVMGRGAVFSPTHSFGVDSSRVLEEIMDAAPRSAEVQAILDSLSKQVGAKNLVTARALVDELRSKLELGEDDPEVVRARTLLDFLEGEG